MSLQVRDSKSISVIYDAEERPNIVFRSIQEDDFQQIKDLHEEFFPVKYADSFYINICQGKGPNGAKIFSSIALVAGEIIGFVLAQLFRYPLDCEDRDLFAPNCNPTRVCYILTLGLKDQYRRSGLGSTFIKQCEEYASTNPLCGAVYLHVIHDNAKAIAFYRKNNYMELRHLDDFYHFNDSYHSAYLYILYIHGNKPPIRTRVWISASYLLNLGMSYISNLLELITPSAFRIAPTTQNTTSDTCDKNSTAQESSTNKIKLLIESKLDELELAVDNC